MVSITPIMKRSWIFRQSCCMENAVRRPYSSRRKQDSVAVPDAVRYQFHGRPIDSRHTSEGAGELGRKVRTKFVLKHPGVHNRNI